LRFSADSGYLDPAIPAKAGSGDRRQAAGATGAKRRKLLSPVTWHLIPDT
jgi:hypothetical protein